MTVQETQKVSAVKGHPSQAKAKTCLDLVREQLEIARAVWMGARASVFNLQRGHGRG